MEETKDGLTRRSFLVNGSTAMGAIGLAAGLTAGSLISPREADANLAIGVLDFPHVSLDVEQVRKYGYYNYQKVGGCGLGSARALIQGFLDGCAAAQVDPRGWAQVPLNLYAWCNGGGAGGWGTLCGAIAGSVGVLNLLNLHGTLASPVFEWYVKQNFPLANLDDYVPSDTVAPIRDADVRGHSVPDSPLCHISVSKWLAAANTNLAAADSIGRNLKKDRCAKVTGDTAAYTAQLLNNKLAGTNPAAWAKPPHMATCFDCHVGTNKDVEAKMSCTPCHTEPVSGRK
jgi:hypothetical protein